MKSHIITKSNYLRLGLALLAEQCGHTVNIVNLDNEDCLNKVEVDDIVIFHMDRNRPSLFSLIIRLSGKVKLILISSYNIKLDAICNVSEILSESVSVDYFISVLMRPTEYHILRNDNTPPLTSRERMVLIDILHGKSAYHIGKKLGLSSKTIYTHKLNAFRKLDARNLHDVLLLAKLITLPSESFMNAKGKIL